MVHTAGSSKAADSPGVVLSVAYQSVTCTAPALQYVDVATRTATTLSDAPPASAARQAVTSTDLDVPDRWRRGLVGTGHGRLRRHRRGRLPHDNALPGAGLR